MADIPSAGGENDDQPRPETKPAAVKHIGIDGLRKLKESAPGAADMSDAEFALAAHQHHYSDVPLVDFLEAVGLDRGDVLYETRGDGDPYGDYARRALARPGANESEDDAAKRQGGALPEKRPGTGEGMARAALQGATFGLGDEAVAAGAALLDPVVHGDSGKDFGERFNTYLSREQGAVQNFREDNPVAAYGTEIAASIPTSLVASGPALAVRGNGLVRALALGSDAALQGAAYGAGGTDGGLEERAGGALVGAGLGITGATAGSVLGKIPGAVGKVLGERAARKATIAAAPSAAEIRALSKGHYAAAKASDAVIDPNAMKAMKTRARDVFVDEGLVFPSGRLAEGYPKLKNAYRAIQEYSKGPVDIAQAQRINKALRTAASSSDQDEARVARDLLDEFNTFMESLPQSAFIRGDGQVAVKEWAAARQQWARFKRTQTIEDAMAAARTSQHGFAEGMRRQFASIANSRKKQLGFTDEEVTEMRRVAEGAPIEDLMKFLQRGGALPAYAFGHVTLGPLGGAGMALAKMAGNAGLRAASNKAAEGTAEAIRAGVAQRSLGGIAATMGRTLSSSASKPVITRPGGHMTLGEYARAGGMGSAQQARDPLEITVNGGAP